MTLLKRKAEARMISHSLSDSVARVRRKALRLLFPLTLPWIPLFLYANDIYNAVPEGSRLHDAIEALAVPAFLIISTILSLLIYRFGPNFLCVQKRVPVRFWVTWIIAHTLVVYVVLTIATVLVSLIIDPPPWKSDNLQYIPLVFFSVVFYPPLLTPMVVIVTLWRTILRNETVNE